MKKIITLIIFIIGTFIIGTLPSWFIDFNTSNLIKPILYPNNLIFPIAWSILYFLLAISLYLTYQKTGKISIIYIISLIVNSLWTVFFFGLEQRFVSFIIILILIVLVIYQVKEFYKISKISAYINIIYLLWLIYASYLNLSIFILNA